MINTFDLIVYFRRGYMKHYYNVSRVAVNRFIEWHEQNPDYCGYVKTDAGSDRA